MSSHFFSPTQRLLCKDGSTVLANHALEVADYVLIYFGASWCEPCCEFAPLLRTFYEKYHDAKAFEVVLLSFDNSEAAMLEHFHRDHGDYYCLPYPDALATRLDWMGQCNVKGLPSLLIFENTAPPRVVVTRYGCNMIVSDPDGAGFPWPQTEPMAGDGSLNLTTLTDAVAVPFFSLSTTKPDLSKLVKVEEAARRSVGKAFFDNPAQELLQKDGGLIPAMQALQKADYVLVYFSAAWCPHCVKFTPLLKKFYEANHVEKAFEVVFFSLDESEEAMWNYFHNDHGDYFCLPYSDAQDMRSLWLEQYNVEFIPTLLVFEAGLPRVLVSSQGREMVLKDPEAQLFPWPQTEPVAVDGTSNLTKLMKAVAVPFPPFSPTDVDPSKLMTLEETQNEKAERQFFDNPAQELLRKDGTLILATQALQDADYVLVYFSEAWNPECTKFTPLLSDFYEAKHVEKKFEVVLFPTDTMQIYFDYFFFGNHGNYYALPYADAQEMKSLWLKLYSVDALPTLLVFKKGYPRVLVSTQGCEMVKKDPEAHLFPWPDASAVNNAWEASHFPWSTPEVLPLAKYTNKALKCVLYVFLSFVVFILFLSFAMLFFQFK